MTIQETFTIVHSSGKHYDTIEEKFLASNWERTMDSKAYLERIMENDKEKFEGCKIENNVE
jgi:hypothetical protein